MSLRAPWARVWRLQEERLRERRLARPGRVSSRSIGPIFLTVPVHNF